MKLIILESPYAATDRYSIEDHITYARACVLYSLRQGEAPIASHLLYTQEGILKDSSPDERKLGIAAGLSWLRRAEASIFYGDLGISKGMEYGLQMATQLGVPVEHRLIGWTKK